MVKRIPSTSVFILAMLIGGCQNCEAQEPPKSAAAEQPIAGDQKEPGRTAEAEKQEDAAASVEAEVLDLDPIAYWPADEGRGTVLHDRSGGGNDGKIYSVSWRDGFLEFDNDVYQWVEVPYQEDFGSRNFSMGGWLYSAYDTNPQSESRFGAILIGQPFSWARNYDGDAISWDKRKLKWRGSWGENAPGGVALRYGIPPKGSTTYVEVASGTKNDALGTVADNVSFPANSWQHLFYTYNAESGTGSVYLNGKRVKSVENVPFEPTNTPLVIGGGRWGTFNLGGMASLDGTLRQMAFFNRTLSSDDVKHLCDSTRPKTKPTFEPYSKRHHRRKSSYNKLVAAKSLSVNAESRVSPAELIARVKDKTLDDLSRGKAALQLAAMGANAKVAVPVLIAQLRKMVDADDAHLPKVEEFLRNALIRALLDIDREAPGARKILEETLVKPFLEKMDTSEPYFDNIRPLMTDGQWFEALQTYREKLKTRPKITLPRNPDSWAGLSREQIDALCDMVPLGPEYFSTFLCRNIPMADQRYSAYNSVDNTPDGYTYTTTYERVPYDEVQNQFDEHLNELTDNRPDLEHEHNGNHARTWTRQWTRLKIVQVTPDGQRSMAYLEGPWFIYDAFDAKNDGWSVIADEKGYIHVWGGQHNTPNEEYYLPGIWPKLGMKEGERAGNLYWVSKKPHDITDFEFVGQAQNPRGLKGWLNYMNLVRSRSGQIFIYCRGSVWTWALHRYDADRRRWTMIKGSAKTLMNHAEQRNPEWYARLGNTVPVYGPADGFVVAWQPGAYNFCRTWPNLTGNVVRGITFDPSGRMHVCLALLGVIEGGEVAHRPVYAYSDDLGDTFYSADGKKLTLPLTHNPIPGHNADRTLEPARSHFEVWASLARELGSLD